MSIYKQIRIQAMKYPCQTPGIFSIRFNHVPVQVNILSICTEALLCRTILVCPVIRTSVKIATNIIDRNDRYIALVKNFSISRRTGEDIVSEF